MADAMLTKIFFLRISTLGKADEMLTKIFCQRSSNLGRADGHLGEGELADREGDQRCANLVMIGMRMRMVKIYIL